MRAHSGKAASQLNYFSVVVVKYLLGLLESSSQWVQFLNDLSSFPALPPLEPAENVAPNFLIVIVVELIEGVKYSHG